MKKSMLNTIDDCNKVISDPGSSKILKEVAKSKIRLLRLGQSIDIQTEITEASNNIKSCEPSTPKVSIIVPVFKTEQYLKKCLDSITSQTLQDIEIICVDDCSPDNSWSILTAYAEKDNRIKIIKHQENLGLGGARNTAINVARADYIASVDSDDYIDSKMIESLYNNAIKTNACVVVCGFERVDSNGNLLTPQKVKQRIIQNENNSIDIFSTCNPAFWNKLWKKSLFIENNIYFPNYVFYQDLATTPRILTKAKTISFISDRPYYYLIREGTATYSHTPKHIADYYTVFGLLRNYLFESNLLEKYFNSFCVAVKRGCLFRASNIKMSGISESEKIHYLDALVSIHDYFTNKKLQIPGKTTERMLSHIENDGFLKIPLTICVKTILRPDLIYRFLESIGSYQNEKKILFYEVIIGDDSPSAEITKNAEAIKKIQTEHPNLNVKHLVFEYDIGCSKGRNLIVNEVKTKYLLQCDDDFIIDKSCDIQNALKFFERRQIDIMGGWLKNKYNTRTGEYEFRCAAGYFTEVQDTLMLKVNENKYDERDYIECEFIMNFFIAKTNAVKAVLWDSELKTEEHHEFFFRAKKKGIRIAVYKGLFACHTYEKPNNSEDYKKHRFDKERWKKYLFLSIKKHNFSKRIIETIKHDRKITWTIDAINQTSKETTTPIEG